MLAQREGESESEREREGEEQASGRACRSALDPTVVTGEGSITSWSHLHASQGQAEREKSCSDQLGGCNQVGFNSTQA